MIDRLPHEKGFHVSWDQIHRDARALAWRLDGKGPDNGAWRAVVGITRGGLVPAMIVSRELDIRVVDTISVKSYSHQAQAAEAIVTKAPQPDLMGDGTGILIVDDLVDTGKTLELVRRLYPKAHFATVYAKPSGKPMVDSYITEVSQDTWIFFHGTWHCNMYSRSAAKTDDGQDGGGMLINPASRLGIWLHWLFEASLILKGLFAAGESLGGLGLLLIPNIAIISVFGWLSTLNLAPHPDVASSLWVQHLSEVFSIKVQHFYALYLLAHGGIKLAMVVMLSRRILWAYPGAMLLLAGFVVFQVGEYLTHGSLTFLILSFLDSVMIVLVFREWNVLRVVRDHPAQNPVH